METADARRILKEPGDTEGKAVLPAKTLEAVRAKYPANTVHPLLITEVTRMQNGHYCVAAYDVHAGRMVRPLRPKGENWIFDEFQAAFRPGQLVRSTPSGTIHGHFPHCNEDMVLKGTLEVLEVWTEAELYAALLETASATIVQIFGERPLENRYFVEGTRCPSLGSVRIARRRILFHSTGNNRLRLHVEDNDGIVYSLPITCDRLRVRFESEEGKGSVQAANTWLQTVPPRMDVLLRVGLTRGYAGSGGEFNPRRCYVQINGILTASSCTMI